MRRNLLIGLCAVSLAATAACGGADNTNTANANMNANMANANMTSSAGSEAMNTPDNSEISRAEENGVVTETRTFKSGNVQKVVVTTRGGKRTARVYARSGEIRDLPEGKVESALTATGDAISSAAGFVADKAGDVGRPVYEGGKTVVEKTAEGAKTGAEKTAAGAKKVGGAVADKSADIGRGVADTAGDVGSATVNGAKKVGRKTASGAKKVGGAIKDAIKN